MHEPTPELLALKKTLYNNGLFTMMRGHHLFCNPPLIITKEQVMKEEKDNEEESWGLGRLTHWPVIPRLQMDEGFDIVDKSLDTLDKALGL